MEPILINGRPLTNAQAFMAINAAMEEYFRPIAQASDFKYKMTYGQNGQPGPGEGDTNIYNDFGILVPKSVRIGCSKALINPEKADKPVKPEHFIASLITVAHEYQHVKQYTTDAEKKSYPSQAITTNMYSTGGNHSYYTQNYMTNPTEIDANYRGLKDTYQILSSLIGKEQAERCICEYQTQRYNENKHDKLKAIRKPGISAEMKRQYAQTPVDFIPGPKSDKYESVQEIFDAYEKAMFQAIHTPRKYNLERGLKDGDAIAKAFQKDPELYKRFMAEKDGQRQDEMAAHISIASRPGAEAIIDMIKYRSGIDLSKQAAFRKPNIIEKAATACKTIQDFSDNHIAMSARTSKRRGRDIQDVATKAAEIEAFCNPMGEEYQSFDV